MEENKKPKTAWEFIKVYFPDMWQYIIIIIVMIIAAMFIL
jgi:hypothetical protein